MRVIMWGKSALKYAPQVALKQAIELTMGTISAAYPKFEGDHENLIDTEFNIPSTNEVKFYGVHSSAVSPSAAFVPVSLELLALAPGYGAGETYLCSQFKLVTGSTGSYGAGLVVDGKFKLAVQTSNFKVNERFEPGVCLRLEGVVCKHKLGGQFLKVHDMNHVHVVEGKLMTLADMKKAITSALSKARVSDPLTPCKRQRDPDLENESPNAKIKID